MAEQHEKALVPQIRFTGFTDPWEQRKLGELASKRIEKNTNGIKETFTNSAEHGVVSQLDYFDHDITNDANIGNYSVVHPDDFIYNPRISAVAPCGPINRNKLGRNGVMSPLYTVFSVDDTIDKLYLEHYFKTSRWHQFMFLEGNSGARSDRFSISDSIFFEMPIQCPVLEEQELIASFFDRLDSLITLHQRKLELLRNIKKSMLDKMFPKGGSLYPEIRFAGFTDPWEQRKLSSTCEQLSRTINPLETPNEEFTEYSMPAFDNNETAETVIGNSMNSLRKIVDRPCLLVNKLNVRKKRIWHVPRPEANAVCSSEFVPFSSHSSDLSFIKISLLSERITAYLESCSSGSSNSQKRVTPEIIMSSEIIAPSLAEQRRIGAFFDRLDSLITLHQRKLELLRNIKKSMLDKMFV